MVKSTGSWYLVESEGAGIMECKLKGNFRIKDIKYTSPVVVGDRVDFEPLDDIGLIYNIRDRKNCIIRKATNLSKTSHIIASNIDIAFLIVTLSHPRTSCGFIDRLLVTAGAYNIPVNIVFNKTDIYDDELKERHNEIISLYRNIGYKCFEISASKGINTELLKSAMKDKIVLFLGHSGVGKSTLINSIEQGLNIKTGKISDYHSKGKHITTFAEMHKLSFGGYMIDTPGIKEFGLIDFSKEEISHFFPEFKSFIPQCQFNTCTHTHEPNCAVIKAYEEGKISESRYKSYLSMLKDY